MDRPREAMRRSELITLVFLTFALAAAANGEPSTFQGLGFFPGGVQSNATGISADGAVVIGFAQGLWNGTYYLHPFRWTEDAGMIGPPPLSGPATNGYGLAVSGDGSTVIALDGSGGPFRWTSSYGSQYLPLDVANATNSDGSVIVGRTSTPCGQTAYRWTALTGAVCLGRLYAAPGNGQSEALGVSGDGTTIVGYSDLPVPVPNQVVAFRWTPQSLLLSLGYLPGGSGRSLAHAVSLDGSVVVGESYSANGNEAFRWTQAGGMVGLGDLPGETFHSRALAVSGDGSVIVGIANSGSPGAAAFIWTQAEGMASLRDTLTGLGLNLTGWTLTYATGVSSDGLTITGYGRDPCDREQAWVAHIGERVCSVDFNGDGVLGVQDVFAFLNAWFDSDPRTDFNGCGLSVQDIFTYLAAWFAGC